jgi:transposase-like protein
VNHRDLRPISADLKLIYQSPTEKDALVHLEEFENKWKSKYPQSVKSWRECWDELSTMFKYPPLIRKLMYTTNAIENFNRQIRKVTKTKGALVSEDAAMKIFYLTAMKVMENWKTPLPGWGEILGNLKIFFDDRVKEKR